MNLTLKIPSVDPVDQKQNKEPEQKDQLVPKERTKKYIILRSLGKGSFGRVKKAQHVISGEKIAVKILEKSKLKNREDMQRVKREIDILKKVNHPNIIQLFEVILSAHKKDY